MSAVLAKPQVKDFLKTLAKGKEKGQEQRKEHDVNAHAATAEGEPSKKPWEEDIPELSSPSYSPPTSFSYSSDSSSSSNPRRHRKRKRSHGDHDLFFASDLICQILSVGSLRHFQRSKTESFILLSNPTPSITNPSSIAENQRLLGSSAASASSAEFIDQNASSSAIQGIESEDQVSNVVEKPVDLYKAIFSDDSDEENLDDQEEKVQAGCAEAAHAALNRLEAGDFLASIGKELGLQVPPTDISQKKRSQDTSYQPQAANVMHKPPLPSSSGSQMLQSAEQVLKFSEEGLETQKERYGNTEKMGVFLDYPGLELNAEHFDVFSKLSSKQSLPKDVFEDRSASKSINNQLVNSKVTQDSSEGTASEDSSDSPKKRRSRKRRKKEHKPSKSEKRRSGKDHGRRKRHEEVKHQSHKHHRRRG
ncbi:hypothetical protein L7F22_044327 [Adiantum nelumboides]|nr:hypothetical protein [Adiantum nelumboides]